MTIHPGLPAVVSARAAFINLSPQLLPGTPSPGSGFLGFLQLHPLSLQLPAAGRPEYCTSFLGALLQPLPP